MVAYKPFFQLVSYSGRKSATPIDHVCAIPCHFEACSLVLTIPKLLIISFVQYLKKKRWSTGCKGNATAFFLQSQFYSNSDSIVFQSPIYPKLTILIPFLYFVADGHHLPLLAAVKASNRCRQTVFAFMALLMLSH